MFIELFQNLGLSKNEAELYEALLELGEASVSKLNQKTNINRRNIYDVLNRMSEKGLVYTAIKSGENRFRPVDPRKLKELIEEKSKQLEDNLTGLNNLFNAKPRNDEVYVYRGVEGWKNYMRDMIRIGEPAYFIGAKGGWFDERVKHFFPHFTSEAKKKKLTFYHLFDWEVQTQSSEVFEYVKDNYRFLPKEYSTVSAIDIFGDHVNILSDLNIGGFEENFSFTVIVNPVIANAFRTWFKYMWDMCPESPHEKNNWYPETAL